MSESNIISAFLAQASATGSRSTVLKPLYGIIPFCFAATMSSAYFKLVEWITYVFAGFSVLSIAVFLFSYIYCLLKDKDALRSETYSIQKMAIEKGFIGDDMSGVIKIDRRPSDILNGSVSSSESGDDK